MDSALAHLVRRILDAPKVSVAIVTGCLVLTAVALEVDTHAPIGQDNTYAIHNFLTRSWLRSPIFQMEQGIVHRFGGVYPMTIYVSGKPGAGRVLEEPAVLEAVDRLAAFLRTQPGGR